MIKKGQVFKAFDFYHDEYWDLTALENEEDGVVKAEFEDAYIVHAQKDHDYSGNYVWCFDTGDL
jgi:hypothetical protein